MENELTHYGIKGQRKGERRWQNPDGSYTPEGFLRYYGHRRDKKKVKEQLKDMKRTSKASKTKVTQDDVDNLITKYFSRYGMNIKQPKGNQNQPQNNPPQGNKGSQNQPQNNQKNPPVPNNPPQGNKGGQNQPQGGNKYSDYANVSKAVGGVFTSAAGSYGKNRDEKIKYEKINKAIEEAKYLSDSELKDRTSRMIAEKNYVSERSAELERGRRKTEDILNTTGKYFDFGASAINLYGAYKKAKDNNP